MKTISVVIPTYNEIENIRDAYERVLSVLTKLEGYDYEIVCIDNCSTDGTRDELRIIASSNPRGKVRLNAVKVGWRRASFCGLGVAGGGGGSLVSFSSGVIAHGSD